MSREVDENGLLIDEDYLNKEKLPLMTPCELRAHIIFYPDLLFWSAYDEFGDTIGHTYGTEREALIAVGEYFGMTEEEVKQVMGESKQITLRDIESHVAVGSQGYGVITGNGEYLAGPFSTKNAALLAAAQYLGMNLDEAKKLIRIKGCGCSKTILEEYSDPTVEMPTPEEYATFYKVLKYLGWEIN